jgi:hypothetical protein
MNDKQTNNNEDIRPQDGTKDINDNQKLDKISQKEKPERKSKGL